MKIDEQVVEVGSPGGEMIGVLAQPASPARAKPIGVVIVVGGPQTRVGSHRQFVLLARSLAGAGYACLRFDYRGMGDSSGPRPDFEQAGPDIRSACDALLGAVASCEGVALWGLCDGATAALLYAAEDERVRLVMAANPWVRNAKSQSAAFVSDHYGSRLRSADFWRRLLTGRVDVVRSCAEAVGHIWRAWRPSGVSQSSEARGAVARLLRTRIPASVDAVILLSGNDLVAREFELAAADWLSTSVGRMTIRRYEAADHTFSGYLAMDAVISDAIRRLEAHVAEGERCTQA